MNSRLITELIPFVVTVADFKEYAKWEGTTEDNTIMAVLTAASKQAELFTRRTLFRGTWRSFIEHFPSAIRLDILPIDISTIVVKYYDSNNALQTLSTVEYFITDNGPNDLVEIKFDGTMPELYDRWEPIYVEFTAGYDQGHLPEGIKVGIFKMAADYFENRTNEAQGSINQFVFGSQQLWYPYKMMG